MNDDSRKLDAAIAEYLEQIEAGSVPDRESFLRRHADLRQGLESFLVDYGRMRSAIEDGQPVSRAIEQHFDHASMRPLLESSLNSTILFAKDAPSAFSGRRVGRRAGSAETPLQTPAESSGSLGLELPQEFGDYELLELIAHGGMGKVYKARQLSLDRIVAVKMILAGQFATEEEVQRFFREAQAAGGLDHPAIVPVFEVGTCEGQHFFSMGFVDGGSLADEVREGPLDERTAARSTQTIAQAVAYAHQRGVIHRDIKPGNVLIDRSGNLRITDFGLARRTEEAGGATVTGQTLGTPAYMPPEQATGVLENVGPLSDVYSIGAVLYCLITGRPPFQASHPVETLRQVIHQEPVAPRQLNPAISADLETICLKCLEKNAAERYGSAQELADDLNRFRNHLPIHARPIGQFARTAKLIRRHRVVSALTAVVAVSLLLGAGISTWFAVQANSRADSEFRARQDLVLKEREATRLASEKSELVEQKTESIRQLEDYLYVSRLREAQTALEAGDLDSCRRLLAMSLPLEGKPDRRCFMWRYLHHRLQRANPHMHRAPGADRGRIAVAPNGRLFAVAYRHKVLIGDLVADNFHRSIEDGLANLTDVGFSKDSRYLAVALGAGTGNAGTKSARTRHDGVFLYDLENPQGPALKVPSVAFILKNNEQNKPDEVGVCVAFSPTETLLACGLARGRIALWNYETGRRIAELSPPDLNPNDMADFQKLLFTPDGKWLVSVRFGRAVDMWDVSAARHEKQLLKYPAWIPFRSRSYRNAFWLVDPAALAISGDGKYLAVAANGLHFDIISLETGLRRQCIGHDDAVSSLAFLPDHKTVVSGSLDHEVRLWNAETAKEAPNWAAIDRPFTPLPSRLPEKRLSRREATT